jgi:hypothetical protein
MNMIGSNALAMLTQQAEETIAELSRVTSVTGENCGRVKDLADNALKLAKDIEESRKIAKSPHDTAAKAVDAAYNPLRDSVTAAARMVKGLVEAWVIAEKRKAEAEAAAARAKAEEAAKLAAEADAFLSDETDVAEAETAALIAETRAMAARQVTSAAGISKVSSLRKVRSAVVTDAKALVLFYAEHPDVLGAATKCANAAIRAAKGGPLTIPGIEIKEEEKLV